jgi:class 3 adenylate cyclase/tetratricopeptide (TPR) repeat protein
MPTTDSASGAKLRDVDAHDDEGERRYLSVMFCDLVDSTPLAERLDPEDLRDFVHQYQRIVEGSIIRHGGRIAQYLGDGVLAYFGYPSAHEDDARRAVMAGLDIATRIDELDNREMASRIAIHTGHVVVGKVNSPGQGIADELMGLAVNVAARLQNFAAPNSVIISEATAALVTGYFDLLPLGSFALKGVEEPVAAYRPHASHPELTRFGRDVTRGLTPFVGRVDDLAYLEQCWHASTQGLSTTTLLIGEPGIGKTRLLWEFRRRLHDTEHDFVELQCLALHDNTQLHPVVQHLRSRLGHAEDWVAPSEQADALQTLLDRLEVPQEPALSLISTLMDLPPRSNETDLPEGIELRRELLMQALREVVIRGEGRRPLLMVIEDLQWADPTTLELVGSLPGQDPVRPVMMVCTARPGFGFPWGNRGDIARRELVGLDGKSAHDIVAWLTGRIQGGSLSEELLAAIVKRSDGVPLFLEEVAALVAARAAEGGQTPVAAVPTSLLDLLVSRVDHLGEAKSLIQAAALIGRDFSVDLLAAIRDEDPAATEATLERPDVSEIVVTARRAYGGGFTFRHALLRDAAYSTLLLRQRRRLHARVGRILIDDEGREVPKYAATPDVIAYHCREGGLVPEAIHYFHVAATRSMSIGANADAVALIDQALELLDGTPAGPDRASTTLVLLASKGPALMAQLGYAHEEVAQTFSHAKGLIDELGDRVELFPVLYGLVAYSAVRCDLDTASELSARLRQSARQANDDDLTMLAHAASAQTDFIMGRFTSAAEHAALCIAHHDPIRQADYRLHFGEDPGTVCRGVACWLAWLRGNPIEAMTSIAATIEAARSLDHAFTLTETLVIAARLHHYMGDVSGVRRVVDEALQISSRHGFPLFIAEATVWSGWADVVDGSDPSGLDRLRSGLEAYRSSGTEMFVPHHLALLGEAAWRLGDGEAALAALVEARRRAAAFSDLDHQVETMRLGAVVAAAHQGAHAEAEELLGQAAQLAAQQGAGSLAVRVAVSRADLARQAGDQGLFDQAVADLAARIRELPEGASSPELEHARALAG